MRPRRDRILPVLRLDLCCHGDGGGLLCASSVDERAEGPVWPRITADSDPITAEAALPPDKIPKKD